MNIEATYSAATGGYETVPKDWAKATASRPFILEDRLLAWLDAGWGAAYGFAPDPPENSWLEFISGLARRHEENWIHQFPEAVWCLEDDRDVTHTASLRRTLQALDSGAPLIAKAALHWSPERLYGVPDCLASSAFIASHWPDLLQGDADPGAYYVLDLKFNGGLEHSRLDREMYSVQCSWYAFMLAAILGRPIESCAFLVGRNGIPFAIDLIGARGRVLHPDLTRLRDQIVDMKLNGHRYSWLDPEAAPGFHNHRDEPWSAAKKRLREEMRPVELLPGVSRRQAAFLRNHHFCSVDDLLRLDPDRFAFEIIPGIGPKRSRQIRSVLRAHREARPSPVPARLVEIKTGPEFFLDTEFLSNVRDCPMLSQVGLGWNAEDGWRFKAWTVDSEGPAAERRLLTDFSAAMKELDPHGRATIWHWSPADRTQLIAAAAKHGLPQVAALNLRDLQRPFLEAPIGIPGAYGYSLKQIATAISRLTGESLEWGSDLAEGLSASVITWRMLDRKEPVADCPEYPVLLRYLENDVRGCSVCRSWLLSNVEEVGEPPHSRRSRPSCKRRALPKSVRPRSRSRHRAGWYSATVRIGCASEGKDSRCPIDATGGWYSAAKDALARPP